MIRDIKLFLKKEIYRGKYTYNTKKTTLLIFVMVFGILLFFKPFGIMVLSLKSQLILTTGLSLCACISYAITMIIYMPFNKSKWTNANELYTYVTCVLMAWLLIYSFCLLSYNVIFTDLLAKENFPFPNYFLLKTFIYTVGSGSAIYSIINILGSLNATKKTIVPVKEAHLWNNDVTIKGEIPSLALTGKNKNEYLEINSDNFICIKSEGHYIKIYYLSNKSHQVESYVIRNTIKEMENQVINFSAIYKCHKSYIININSLKSIIGNSNKSHAYIENYPYKIPISKNKIAYLKNKLSSHPYSDNRIVKEFQNAPVGV